MENNEQRAMALREGEIVSAASSTSRDDLAVAAWLHKKTGKSGSANTARAYQATIDSWRQVLTEARFTLAPPVDADARERWLTGVATVAQGWAGTGGVAPATYNRRCAIVSSCYTFAAGRGFFPSANPLARVSRRSVQGYANAVAVSEEAIRDALNALVGGDLRARRDRVVIGVAIETTRRLSEVAGLRWKHVQQNKDATLTLTFARTKCGRVRRNKLSRALSGELLAYLRLAHGVALADLKADAAIWVSCSRQNRGAALSGRSLEHIARTRLGVHFHALRHTGARLLERKGARVSEIQAQLGHASLATTGRYLVALHSEENAYAEAVAETLGFSEAQFT